MCNIVFFFLTRVKCTAKIRYDFVNFVNFIIRSTLPGSGLLLLFFPLNLNGSNTVFYELNSLGLKRFNKNRLELIGCRLKLFTRPSSARTRLQ